MLVTDTHAEPKTVDIGMLNNDKEKFYKMGEKI